MSKNYFITTPIYYVNDVPHIGHAYTSVACDVISRFMKLNGKNVKFLTGTDEHGQKVEKSAEKFGLSTQEFTDKMSESFKIMMEKLNISYDDFIRTTEQRHKKAAIKFWQKLKDNGNIYLGKYSGWYSVRDEAYYSESELTEDKKAPTGAPVEWIEEPSYFFNLSKWQDKLLKYYEDNPNFIWPQTRRNEIISFVKSGLKDLSISRTSFKWGVKVPNDEEHVMYVWLDALTNYISALGYPNLEQDFSKFWPANAHVIGKDILRFHAVYWPAFLMAAGLELPKSIISHGWWTNEGEKISKSLGNVIDPIELINDFGIDQVRYFMMREVNFGNDGNFSRENMVTRINSELSNKVGNLLQRTLSFSYKYCEQAIPNISEQDIDLLYNDSLLKEAKIIFESNVNEIENFQINKVIENIISLAEKANIYIDNEAPWSLKNTDIVKMNKILYNLLETIRHIAIMLQPFIPESANKMLDQLCIKEEDRTFSKLNRDNAIKAGQTINKPYPIFPRIEK